MNRRMYLDAARTLLRDRRGTSLIELAIAAPLLMIFAVGIADVDGGWSEKYRLQQVVNRSLETPQIAENLNDYSFLETEADAAAGIAASASTLQAWTQCGDQATRYAWDEDCTGGESAKFIKLTIVKSYKPFFGSMPFSNVQADGTVLFTAHGTLRVR